MLKPEDSQYIKSCISEKDNIIKSISRRRISVIDDLKRVKDEECSICLPGNYHINEIRNTLSTDGIVNKVLKLEQNGIQARLNIYEEILISLHQEELRITEVWNGYMALSAFAPIHHMLLESKLIYKTKVADLKSTYHKSNEKIQEMIEDAVEAISLMVNSHNLSSAAIESSLLNKIMQNENIV